MSLELVDVSQLLQTTSPFPMEPLGALIKISSQLECVCDLHAAPGMSAIQVGIPKKIFVIRNEQCGIIGDKRYGSFINCEYTIPPDSRVVDSIERCASFPNRVFRVRRYDRINVNGYMLELAGNRFELRSVNVTIDVSNLSLVFQHKIDHQNGILVSDFGEEIFVW